MAEEKRIRRRSLLKKLVVLMLTLGGVFAIGSGFFTGSTQVTRTPVLQSIKLPKPITIGKISVEEVMAKRRSIREYIEEPLSINEAAQLLWAAQGITDPRYGLRTAPSAGGTYPLEVYLVVKEGGVDGLEAGVYRYDPAEHNILMTAKGDLSRRLMAAAVDQPWVAEAALNIVITGIFGRTTQRYGERGIQYVYQETGHVDQNIYLMAVALNLGTTVIGAFHEDEVQGILGVPKEERPLYIATIGKTKCLGHPNQRLGFCEREP